MNDINFNKVIHEFNDLLLDEIDFELDIYSNFKLKEFFKTYHLLFFHIDRNINNTIDFSNKKKYPKK